MPKFILSKNLNVLKRIFISAFSLALILALSTGGSADTQVSNIVVFADVVGTKPVVRIFSPTTGTNDSPTVMNKIVGLNFGSVAGDILGVFLDDPAGTSLTGTAVLHHNCDINGDDCDDADSDIYQSITGLSIPAGVSPGIYNILVTTAAGTNLISNSKFTVTTEPPGVVPNIINVSPSIVSLMEAIPESVNFLADVVDSDSANTYFDVTNITEGGVSSSAEGSPINIIMIANAGTANFTVSGDASTVAGVGSMTFRVGDGGTPTTGNTNTKLIAIFIDPSW